MENNKNNIEINGEDGLVNNKNEPKLDLLKFKNDPLLNLSTEHSPELKIILETSKRLRLLKATNIKFSQPILKQGENSVIFPNTINVIQGQAGVHKSRLAEIICSSILKLHNCKNELLGFTRVSFDANTAVVYVDTERNLTEQLPYALQSIQLKAGYDKVDHPWNFYYVSLLQITRKSRFTALSEYLTHIKNDSNNQLFIVLDVSTDCIEDFNRTDESLKLIDLMNIAINEHNIVFLCLIHENPKSDKARGHFGTELINKASTVMQISIEKDAKLEDTDLIKVKYLKCRTTAKLSPFFIKYCSQEKSLILADPSEISKVFDSKKHKAHTEDIIEHISMYLGDGIEMSRKELIDKLVIDFDVAMRTIENRFKEIVTNNSIIYNSNAEECYFTKEVRSKEVFYKLTPKTII